MATLAIFYSYKFSWKLTEITNFFSLNLQITPWMETHCMAWTLKDTVPVLLRRVYSLVGGREIQVNNGDTTQDEISPPGVCGGGVGWGCWEQLLRKGDTGDLSESEDVGGEEKKRDGGEMRFRPFWLDFSYPVIFFSILQKNLVLFMKSKQCWQMKKVVVVL